MKVSDLLIETSINNNYKPDEIAAPATRIGEALVAEGVITDHQVRQAVDVQVHTGQFLGQIIVDLGFASAQRVGAHLSRYLGVKYVDLNTIQPALEAVSLMPEDFIRSAQALPIRLLGDSLEVAMADPLDITVVDRIHLATEMRVLPVLTMAGELLRAIDDLFDASSRTTEALQELETAEEASGHTSRSRAMVAVANEAPIVRLVDSIIEAAMAVRASDIHFEPQERSMRVRLRVDGTLLDHATIPRSQVPSVVARLKVLCTMDITEGRKPQDGRMRYDNHGRVFDIRAASVPTVNGEKLVLRILDKAAVLVPLARLGFLLDQEKRVTDLIQAPHGMMLVVGPTGSGKSTTLYSALNMLNDSKRNIMTLEDPVEYNVAGINQIQVNAKVGLTFANGLRSFVRQDPDVILVGEIRDQETAEMAIQAPLTGHLLLSTLHTNSAVGTIARLANLGVDPFLIAQALSGIISQRLVARVCDNCAREYSPSPEVLESVGILVTEAQQIRFKRGAGCRLCHWRGYRGRMGVYEVLVLDEDIKKLIMRGVSDTDLEESAVSNGMMSLWDSCLLAVKAGITTPEEMGRVALGKGA
jgi:type IV pilus assembly protein PilB